MRDENSIENSRGFFYIRYTPWGDSIDLGHLQTFASRYTTSRAVRVVQTFACPTARKQPAHANFRSRPHGEDEEPAAPGVDHSACISAEQLGGENGDLGEPGLDGGDG